MITLPPVAIGALLLLAAAGASAAEPPVVAASIKPVHSLVAAVMQGIAEPHLIVAGVGSPHTYALKPSDAAALQRADLVFWIGPQLETFLASSIGSLAAGARVVALEHASGLTKLALRQSGPFERRDDHDAGAAPAQAAPAIHDDQPHDPHLWLDPANAAAMVNAIENALTTVDPGRAGHYATNAERARDTIAALARDIGSMLAPVRDHPFIVFHDGFQYFEHRFGLNAVGTITVSPEQMPGARRLLEIRARIDELGGVCVFAEPQFGPRLLAAVTDGTNAGSGVLDPLGSNIADGPELYQTLMRNLAAAFADCLKRSG